MYFYIARHLHLGKKGVKLPSSLVVDALGGGCLATTRGAAAGPLAAALAAGLEGNLRTLPCAALDPEFPILNSVFHLEFYGLGNIVLVVGSREGGLLNGCCAMVFFSCKLFWFASTLYEIIGHHPATVSYLVAVALVREAWRSGPFSELHQNINLHSFHDQPTDGVLSGKHHLHHSSRLVSQYGGRLLK